MDTSQKITHVLDRLGFGPRPGDYQRVARIGVEAYIQQQLNPSEGEEPAPLRRQLRQLSRLNKSPGALFSEFAPPQSPSREQRAAARRRQNLVAQEAQTARLVRAIESPNQLQEVMVDFWFNHFNVFVNKGLTRLWLGSFEQLAIRPNALGKFRTLLGATARHPAMLFYLDNWRNTDPESPQARGPFRGLNENYARELLELHTLGVDGGYSQADVESLTRVLTGWSIESHQRRSEDGSGFVFVANRHDGRDKVLLGESIAGGGVEEGERALDMLARHPATARHVSFKLAQYFVADEPPAGLVERLSNRFRQTDGDIRAVLSTLFSQADFWADAHFQQKFKTPYQYVLSMPRAMGVSAPPESVLTRLVNGMNQLSMPLYRCQQPDGYAQVASAWLSPDAMLRRVSLAIRTVNHQRSVGSSEPDPGALLETVGGQLPRESQAIIRDSPAQMQAALILGSPEMMYR
ncbi:MAG: DUF1800 domain-containing protein [Cyanobacteria bacterium J06631_9]